MTSPAGDRTTEAKLLAAIYDAPADDEPRLAYADHLVRRGRSLGQFIRLQLDTGGNERSRKTKARRLFDPTWWPGHPISLIQQGVAFEHVHRGFPAVFAPPTVVSPKARAKDEARWRETVGEPGWSTIQSLGVGFDSEVVPEIIRGAGMPLLEELRDAGPLTLGPLAGIDLPLRLLGVRCTRDAILPRLGHLARLRTLSWTSEDRDRLGNPTTPLRVGLERVRSSGAPERITELRLSGFAVERLVEETLAALAGLPANVVVLRIDRAANGIYVGRAEIRRDGFLRLELSAWEVPGAAKELAQLPASRLASLAVSFRKQYGFSKQNRAALAEEIRSATRQFRHCELDLQ